MTMLTAEALGFETLEAGRVWRKTLAGRDVRFQLLRGIPEYDLTEPLQRAVFGTTDLDTLPGNHFLTLDETGGFVIGAFAGIELVGFVSGYGGWVERRPRLASDIMIVLPHARSGGIGAELKKLQAILALERGFVEISWTVDPLRAANARLNIEKLGAWSHHYERNRYGKSFGAGLYGGMPSDRLHMVWPITTPAVRDRLLGKIAPTAREDVETTPGVDARDGDLRVVVPIPADIDELIKQDMAAALGWRFRVRDQLESAFAAGFVASGFVGADASHPDAALILTREERSTP